MNYQQLEYIIAVDTYRHFVTASEKCHVTQPTLSMMIKKLEEELDVIIFDRTKQPIEPTLAGRKIIDQAKIALSEMRKIGAMVNEMKGIMQGEIHIGIIPTVAPYLIPLFLTSFKTTNPNIHLIFSEITTLEIVDRLYKGKIDCGILATPIHIDSLLEMPMYYEEFLLYASPGHPVLSDSLVNTEMLDYENLWLLEESHCLSGQIINFCDLQEKKARYTANYEVGSIETLRRLTDLNHGITILPEMTVNEFDTETKMRVRNFRQPVPIREISMVCNKYTHKLNLIKLLKNNIVQNIPRKMNKKPSQFISPVF